MAEEQKKQGGQNNMVIVLVIVLFVILLCGLCGLCSLVIGTVSEPDDIEEVEEVEEEEGEKEEVEEPEEKEEEEEPVLSEKEVQNIANGFEVEFEEEKELTGKEYRLHSIEYDAVGNQLNIKVDYQVDPVLPKDELIRVNEAWVWRIVEATPEVYEKDFNVRVSAVTKYGEDDFILWGSSRYTYDTGEYTFRDGPGMVILD